MEVPSLTKLRVPVDSHRSLPQLRLVLGRVATLFLCAMHSWAIWISMGGSAGLNNGWPLHRHDHPLYFHSTLVTREFLKISGTTAGYDPSFMAGYPKSVVFPASSTLPELVVFVFGGSRPELAYKVYVLISAAALPWLMAIAAWMCRLSWPAIALASLFELLYVWSDFPINYVEFGMIPYFLAVPLALVATAVFARYLESGRTRWWCLACLLCSLSFLVHLTTAMIVVPAALFAYLVAVRVRPGGIPIKMHLGVWLIPLIVLVTNAFWWLPGLTLMSTKGASDFVFSHPEGVALRLGHLFTYEAPVEMFLIAIGMAGLYIMRSTSRIRAAAILGFILAGFGWGYLLAGVPAFYFLQPGRHTYVFYSGLALTSAICVQEGLVRLKLTGGAMHRWVALALLLIGCRLFIPVWNNGLSGKFNLKTGMLTSEPTTRMKFILDQVKSHVKKGERLLYEEAGFGADPYASARLSGLIPWATNFDVEVLGGPYLHAALLTNFTQFGEGKLFGQANWGRDRFETYARLYRPSAIVCWSPAARIFCMSNPDLITIKADDGVVLLGRVNGFEGDTIAGKARVEASPGRLTIHPIQPALDGSILLRYHSVPGLRSRSNATWDEILLQGDPVPFLRLMTTDGPTTLEWHLAP